MDYLITNKVNYSSFFSDSTGQFVYFFKKKIWRTSVLFVGPLIPLFWTSGDVYPGFQSQSGYPCLHAFLPVCNKIPRFTSAATPADLFVARIVPELFQSMYL